MKKGEEPKCDHRKVAGVLNEQIDSVMRRWLDGKFTDPELELYLMQFSREGLAHALMATLNMFKKKSLEAIPKLVKEFDTAKLPESFEEMGEKLGESAMHEITELDGLMNQLLNDQITLVEFLKRTKKFSKKSLRSMLGGFTIGLKTLG